MTASRERKDAIAWLKQAAADCHENAQEMLHDERHKMAAEFEHYAAAYREAVLALRLGLHEGMSQGEQGE